MPPLLALVLCTGFVLFLLKLERKQESRVSRLSWLPTIWLLYIASKPLGVWFQAAGTIESGSIHDQIFLALLLCLAVLVLFARSFPFGAAFREQPWLLALIVYMLLSVFWTDSPLVGLRRWIREASAIVMAFVILSEPLPRETLESLLRRSVYVLIPYSIMLIKYYPHYGRLFGRWSGQEMWIGVTLQKNGLGRLCMIAGFFLVWTLFRRWRGRGLPAVKYQTYADVAVLLMTAWLLRGPGGAYSASAIGSLIVGLAAFFGLLWMKKRGAFVSRGALMAVAAFLIVFGTITPFVGGSTISPLTSTLGRDETLTGRTEIWAGLIPIAMQHPILGSGFGGFWTSQAIEEHGERESHNGYLETFVTLGFVGLLLWSLLLLSWSSKYYDDLIINYDWGALAICMLLMTLAHNIAETSISTFCNQLIGMLLFFAFVPSLTGAESSESEQELQSKLEPALRQT